MVVLGGMDLGRRLGQVAPLVVRQPGDVISIPVTGLGEIRNQIVAGFKRQILSGRTLGRIFFLPPSVVVDQWLIGRSSYTYQ